MKDTLNLLLTLLVLGRLVFQLDRQSPDNPVFAIAFGFVALGVMYLIQHPSRTLRQKLYWSLSFGVVSSIVVFFTLNTLGTVVYVFYALGVAGIFWMALTRLPMYTKKGYLGGVLVSLLVWVWFLPGSPYDWLGLTLSYIGFALGYLHIQVLTRRSLEPVMRR